MKSKVKQIKRAKVSKGLLDYIVLGFMWIEVFAAFIWVFIVWDLIGTIFGALKPGGMRSNIGWSEFGFIALAFFTFLVSGAALILNASSKNLYLLWRRILIYLPLIMCGLSILGYAIACTI